MRLPLRTTIDEDLLDYMRFKALELKVDMNDILEQLIIKYKAGEIQLDVKRKRGER